MRATGLENGGARNPPGPIFAGTVSEAQKSSYVVNTNVIFCSRPAGGENRIRVPPEGDAALYVMLARVMRR
jgi:hypothetical protein